MIVVGLFVEVVALLLLVACWLQGDIPLRSKIIWTVVYVLTWVPLLFSAMLHVATQALFGATLCFSMFGPSH
jgi:hypothetical protein